MAGIETKQKLIETTMELIWKNSYATVTVDDICKAARVKKGSFYHFFPAKEDLAVAAMDEAAKFIKASHRDIAAASKSAMERLDRYAEYTCETQFQAAKKYGHVLGCPATSLGSELACQESRIREGADAVRRQHLENYEDMVKNFVADGLLPEDTDTKDKAQKVNSYITGLLTTARIDNNLTTLKQDLKSGVLQILGVAGEAKAT